MALEFGSSRRCDGGAIGVGLCGVDFTVDEISERVVVDGESGRNLSVGCRHGLGQVGPSVEGMALELGSSRRCDGGAIGIGLCGIDFTVDDISERVGRHGL